MTRGFSYWEDVMRSDARFVQLFVSTAILATLLLYVSGTGLPQAVFEGVVGGGGATLGARWWARRSATRASHIP